MFWDYMERKVFSYFRVLVEFSILVIFFKGLYIYLSEFE